jgi:hypothetical protein
MGFTQEDILLSLIQGDDGQKWAENRIGWKKDTNRKGERGELSRLFPM